MNLSSLNGSTIFSSGKTWHLQLPYCSDSRNIKCQSSGRVFMLWLWWTLQSFICSVNPRLPILRQTWPPGKGPRSIRYPSVQSYSVVVRPDLRRRQRRSVLQPGDLGLCGQAVETPGVLQQHLLQCTGEHRCPHSCPRNRWSLRLLKVKQKLSMRNWPV